MFRIQCWGDPDILASFAVLSGLQFWASPVLCFFFLFCPLNSAFYCAVFSNWNGFRFGLVLAWAGLGVSYPALGQLSS